MPADTMKAARLHAYGEPLELDEVPVPRPEEGQVLVRVEGVGFCHSDLHIISGELQMLPRMPFTLGHENAGRVAAVGKGVASVKEGDPVAVYGGWGTAPAVTVWPARRTCATPCSGWGSPSTRTATRSTCSCRGSATW